MKALQINVFENTCLNSLGMGEAIVALACIMPCMILIV